MTVTVSTNLRGLAVENTDEAWEYYGRTDPYYGVLTNEAFSRENFDAEARAKFFKSGEQYIGLVLDTIREHLVADFEPKAALDFGCGVGRLSLPFARLCERVVGVDISESMLSEARRNARSAGCENIEFVRSDDELSQVSGSFDLVNSFITFQHIPWRRGRLILRQILGHLADGGVGVLQVVYAHASATPPWRISLTRAYERVPALYAARNKAKGDQLRPPMQMNVYPLNDVLRTLQEADCHQVHVRFTEANHYGFPVYGAVLYFLKKPIEVTAHA